MDGPICIILFSIIFGLLFWGETTFMKRRFSPYKDGARIGDETIIPLALVNLVLTWVFLHLLGWCGM